MKKDKKNSKNHQIITINLKLLSMISETLSLNNNNSPSLNNNHNNNRKIY